MTNFKFGLVVAGVFVVSMVSIGSYIKGQDPAFKAEVARHQAERAAEAHDRPQAPQALAQADAGKPWRQWSEQETTEFLRRGLTICVKKDFPAQQQCLDHINGIVDDWRANH
jgi:hypothetical protein